VVRSLIEHGLKPKEECSACGTGPMFRYERPRQGQQQFHQLGVEVLGSADPERMRRCDRYGYSAKPRAENLRLDLNSVGNLEDRQHYRKHW